MDASARTLLANIAQVDTEFAQLRDVAVRLHWLDEADTGTLSLDIGLVHAPTWGQRFEQLHWQCPLHRHQGWQCEGELRSGVSPPLRLTLALSDAAFRAHMSDGTAHLDLRREAATSDLISIDLAQVPLLWLQSWLLHIWPEVRLGEGQLDGSVRILMGDDSPTQVETAFSLNHAALETDRGDIAMAGIGMQAELVVSTGQDGQRLDMRGSLHGGEVLIGNAYLALPHTPITLEMQATRRHGDGWQLPHLLWRDGNTLEVNAALTLTAAAAPSRMDVHVRSRDLSPWPERYLSGWLGLAGLSGLTMRGVLDVQLSAGAEGIGRVEVHLEDVHLNDANGRFALAGVYGHLHHAVSGQHGGELAWHSGALGGIAFGPARWPLQSTQGLLQLQAPVEVTALDGQVRLDPLRLRLPHAGRGLQLDFGLFLQQLDLAPLSTALGWPAFRGQLTGSIPEARYRDGWLDLDGGLSLALFDGRIDVTSLVMERPFGVAPTLTADLTLMNLDLMSITEVFDFGSISGRLDGRIEGLRLVDWTPIAFTAELHTVPGRGVRQRISQRAVQDISSVGGGGIMHSLQGRLIGLFDDFGYRRIGLACRLLNEVCAMSGLESAGSGFVMVEGSGLPRLNVVGFNREVDWPTLVERLVQIADGAAPVVE